MAFHTHGLLYLLTLNFRMIRCLCNHWHISLNFEDGLTVSYMNKLPVTTGMERGIDLNIFASEYANMCGGRIVKGRQCRRQKLLSLKSSGVN